MERLNSATIKMYTTVRCFLANLKNDVRGLDGPIAAILLVLVAVLAVAAIWGALNGWLGDLWNTITGVVNTDSNDGSYSGSDPFNH